MLSELRGENRRTQDEEPQSAATERVDEPQKGLELDVEPEQVAALPVQRVERKAPGSAVAQQPQQTASGIGALAGIRMPARLDVGTTKPLNVRVPGSLHHTFKVITTVQGLTMEDVISALVTQYLHDPDLIARLIDEAADAGKTFGELTHAALLTVGEEGEQP